MTNATQHYHSSIWYDQTLSGKSVRSIQVRIFEPVETVTCNNNLQNNNLKLVATKGDTIQKTSRSSRKYISNYSYVILSTGFYKRGVPTSSSLFIRIRVYVTKDFTLSQLENVDDFSGKSYVIQALSDLLNK